VKFAAKSFHIRNFVKTFFEKTPFLDENEVTFRFGAPFAEA